MASQPRMMQQGQPMTSAPVTSGSILGARPARVISTGGIQGAPQTVTMSAQPQYIQGQRTVVSSGAIQGYPQIVQQSRPATIIGGGEVKQNTIGGPVVTQAAYEVKHKDDPQLQNLKELRKTCGLKNVPVNDALQAFKTMSSDGKLTRDQFIAAYTTLLQQFEVEVPEEAVKNAVFNVFDENGDGVISMDEMFKFLTSVFKVVLTPNVMDVMNSMGVAVESAEDLASVTALECFKTADLNHDGKLSVAEFKNWFFAPRNDPSFLFSPVRKLLQ